VSNTGGGGLSITSSSATLNLALTTVAANMTAGAGGGLNTASGNNVITSSDFLSNNAATGGGGIYHTGSNMLLNMSSVIANTAGGQGSGGGVYNSAGTVNIINTTVANNTAGLAGGGLSNNAGGTASLLYATVAFNQAALGGGIEATGGATTALGNSIVTQNFNYAYPGVNFVTNAAYPGNQNGNLLPTPPFPTPATTGPDIHGTVADLTETGLVASMGGNLSAAIGALAAAATTIGHNIFGTVDGNNTAALLAVHGDQVGTSSAPILAVLPVAPNGGSTLVGPTLPGNQAQYMAAPQAAPAGTSNPLTTALKNGFADTFVFNVAPGDQRGTPVLNTVSGLSQQYLRPITITFTMPPSNNPTVGAMQVN
jgi:hypothetical protein